MPEISQNQNFDEILRNIGPDATATFDNSASNPTEHASSEGMYAAAADVDETDDDAIADEDEDVDDDEDDDEAEEEEEE